MNFFSTITFIDFEFDNKPIELKEMILGIRQVETAIGHGLKTPTESEERNKTIARKSLVAKKNIYKGEVFTCENLTVKRPGDGISPMKWFEIIGTKAIRDFEEDELIEI